MIASTLTFIGSVSQALFESCDITSIDCDRISWNMVPDLLAQELEKRPDKSNVSKAVVLVHLSLKVPYLRQLIFLKQKNVIVPSNVL